MMEFLMGLFCKKFGHGTRKQSVSWNMMTGQHHYTCHRCKATVWENEILKSRG